MKKIFTLLVAVLGSMQLHAQVLGTDLNINNVSARINNNNNHFWDPIGQTNYYFVPVGSNKQTLYAGDIWIGGYDNANQLHVAAETYAQNGDQAWWPGPLDMSNGTAANANTWNQIWKVDRTTILNHINNWNVPGYIIPAEIADWPGNAPAGSNYQPVLAPFFDSNNNQIYEPAIGEFPFIFGDQAVYFINNDNYLPQPLGAPAMKVEVHGMAFAYSDPGVPFLDNTIFFRYQIVNRSGIQYNDVRFSLWTDSDLGNAVDDYFGTDVGRNMYYFYNADPDDEGGAGYGFDPPCQGIMFLNQAMSSSLYYTNMNASPTGNPDTYEDYYQYMNATWLDGLPVTYGNSGRDPGTACSYMFPALTDPAFPGQNWTMATAGMQGTDMRGMGSISIPTYPAGAVFTVDAAYITAFPDSGTGPNGSIEALQEYADSIVARYSTGTITGVEENVIAVSDVAISVQPNPLSDYSVVSVNSKSKEEGILRITGVDGRIVFENKIAGEQPVLIQKKDFAAGIYVVNAYFKNSVASTKLIVR